MVVLVVGCGNYTGLAGVDGVVAGVDAMKRRLVEQGAEVRTLEGRVTERRLERALRSIGKVARRGERAAIVLIGHTVAGGFAVENFAMRKAGKRLRNFSAARIAHLMGGVAFGGGVATAKVNVPVVVLPPLDAPRDVVMDGPAEGGPTLGGTLGGPGRGSFTPGEPSGGSPMPNASGTGFDPTQRKKKKPFFDPNWNGRIGWWLGIGPHSQIEAGNLGFRWSTGGGGLTNVEWLYADTAFVEISTPLGKRGLLEIQRQDGFEREIWRFEDNGSWPHSDFKLRLLLDSNASGYIQEARGWPIGHQVEWKGFSLTFGVTVTLSSAFRLSTPGDPPLVYAQTQTLGQIRFVTGWFGKSSKNVLFKDGIIDAKHGGAVTIFNAYHPQT